MSEWKPIESCPENERVMTKIHDNQGSRNEQYLVKQGRLFFTGLDGSGMYVYYTPTHWKSTLPVNQEKD